MSFGKSTQPKRRRRPIENKADEIAPEVVQEKKKERRKDRLNAPVITSAITGVGSLMMLGVVAIGAPYSYGAQSVHYSSDLMMVADQLATAGKAERDAADPRILVDFSTIVTTPEGATTDAKAKVAATCRTGGAARLAAVPPKSLHRAFKQSTRFLTCAMATLPQRLCAEPERRILVDQLMAYAERRQNVVAFEAYREHAVAEREQMREYQRENGRRISPKLNFHSQTLKPGLDPVLRQQMEALVRNGYLSASDFGYLGLYVPRDFVEVLRIGADRYPVCPTAI